MNKQAAQVKLHLDHSTLRCTWSRMSARLVAAMTTTPLLASNPSILSRPLADTNSGEGPNTTRNLSATWTPGIGPCQVAINTINTPPMDMGSCGSPSGLYGDIVKSPYVLPVKIMHSQRCIWSKPVPATYKYAWRMPPARRLTQNS